MSNTILRPLLNTALVVLLSVLVSPNAFSKFSTKAVSLSSSTPSMDGIQNTLLGKSDDDKPKLNLAPEWVIEPPTKAPVAYRVTQAPTPNIAFTVSQARAPPPR